MLQPIISSCRPGIGVNVAVIVTGILDGTSVSVMVKGRVMVGGVDGINDGVGDRITGKEEGEVRGVLMVNGCFIPPHAVRNRMVMRARIVFTMITSDWIIVSEKQE